MGSPQSSVSKALPIEASEKALMRYLYWLTFIALCVVDPCLYPADSRTLFQGGGSEESQKGGTHSFRVVDNINVVKVNNYARRLGEFNGRTYFEWRVFIDEPPQVLDRIAEVQYELHPTFDQRFQTRSDPGTKFALERGGWGQFRILITIRYKDGRVGKTSYQLDLAKQWPENAP